MTQATALSPQAFQDAVKPLLNRWGPYRLTRDEITDTAIRRFCEVAEDGNPVYWDADYAKQTRFGRVIAPPQSIFSMTFAPWWTPSYLQERTSADAAALNPAGTPAEAGPSAHQLSDEAGYTVATVVGQEVEYIAPFGPGDGRLKMRSMTTDVSVEKQTRPGRGVFITSVTEYRTEHDDRLVAKSTMVLLKYNPNSPRGE
jgi:acyl dehydratase